MPFGAITSHIDVAQVVLYTFWLFFLGLVLYLRYEDQREGYPLENEEGPTNRAIFYPPPAKTYMLPGGATTETGKPERPDVKYKTSGYFIGNPIEPEGEPLSSGVGSASYAQRFDVPDVTFDGHNRIVPLRVAGEFGPDEGDKDPRGYQVLGSDQEVAGKVVDIWVDRSEYIFRYYEVELADGQRRLTPVLFTVVNKERKTVFVDSITAAQFAGVPALADADQVTRLEEDKIVGYFGGGYLYSSAQRLEPYL